MKRVLSVLILALILVSLCGNAWAIEDYDGLIEKLKYRLAEGSSPELSYDDLMCCIIMGRIAVLNHGLAGWDVLNNVVVIPNQSFVSLGDNSLDIMFVCGVALMKGKVIIKTLQEFHLQDLAHKQLETTVPLSYYSFFRHLDSTFIYLYPVSTATETLRVYVVKCGFSSPLITEDPSFEESWLNYSLFIACIILEDWQRAAEAYNSYQEEIAFLREKITNRQTDVSIAPKIIK